MLPGHSSPIPCSARLIIRTKSCVEHCECVESVPSVTSAKEDWAHTHCHAGAHRTPSITLSCVNMGTNLAGRLLRCEASGETRQELGQKPAPKHAIGTALCHLDHRREAAVHELSWLWRRLDGEVVAWDRREGTRT